MKIYAEFYILTNRRWNNETKKLEIVEPFHIRRLGSDGIFILDGRKNVRNLIPDCKEAIKRLKNIGDISGFKIIRSEHFTDDPKKVIYSSF